MPIYEDIDFFKCCLMRRLLYVVLTAKGFTFSRPSRLALDSNIVECLARAAFSGVLRASAILLALGVPNPSQSFGHPAF